MSSKLRIKVGQAELEYEGNATFDKESLKDLLGHLQALASAMPAAPVVVAAAPETSSSNGSPATSKIGTLHINTVASRLGASSTSDLAIAAAAHLQIVLAKESFSRKDLLDTMRAATTYYNTNMSSNLSKAIDTLIGNKRINQLGQSNYSLSAGELTSAKAKLAES